MTDWKEIWRQEKQRRREKWERELEVVEHLPNTSTQVRLVVWDVLQRPEGGVGMFNDRRKTGRRLKFCVGGRRSEEEMEKLAEQVRQRLAEAGVEVRKVGYRMQAAVGDGNIALFHGPQLNVYT